MVVSKNKGTPKSSILIGFSIINHPFWGTLIFGNTHINLSNYNAMQLFDGPGLRGIPQATRAIACCEKPGDSNDTMKLDKQKNH